MKFEDLPRTPEGDIITYDLCIQAQHLGIPHRTIDPLIEQGEEGIKELCRLIEEAKK